MGIELCCELMVIECFIFGEFFYKVLVVQLWMCKVMDCVCCELVKVVMFGIEIVEDYCIVCVLGVDVVMSNLFRKMEVICCWVFVDQFGGQFDSVCFIVLCRVLVCLLVELLELNLVLLFYIGWLLWVLFSLMWIMVICMVQLWVIGQLVLQLYQGLCQLLQLLQQLLQQLVIWWVCSLLCRNVLICRLVVLFGCVGCRLCWLSCWLMVLCNWLLFRFWGKLLILVVVQFQLWQWVQLCGVVGQVLGLRLGLVVVVGCGGQGRELVWQGLLFWQVLRVVRLVSNGRINSCDCMFDVLWLCYVGGFCRFRLYFVFFIVGGIVSVGSG